MSKQKAVTADSVFGELFHIGLYKPSQGRVTRQVTCGAIWVIVGLCAYRLYQTMYWAGQWQYLASFGLLAIGLWAAYRLVNYPKFADFLIAVEAEMNKVSWPSRSKLIKSSMVVIFVIFALASVLFLFDLFWRFLFRFLGVLQ